MTERIETAPSTEPRARITGPIAGSVPSVGLTSYDLGPLGYEEVEFFVSGDAQSYDMRGERSETGRHDVIPLTTAPFTTRIVVRRPFGAANLDTFDGTVVVEWNNVSGGGDGSPDWTMLHREIVRHRWIWVGVTAQKVGVDGGGFVEGLHLKKLAPERYASLVHPGDAFSYDIFSQVGRALRESDPASPLGSLAAERLLAVGESQSAGCLVTYINALDGLAQVYDGFLVHSRGASGAPLEGLVIPRGPDGETIDLETLRRSMQRSPEPIRDDVRVPVLIIQSETDVVGTVGTPARQQDTERIRLWEMAGTAHADTYMLVAGAFDDGHGTSSDLADRLAPTRDVMGMSTQTPINSAPQHHYVAQAALAHLDAWARTGAVPPRGAPIDIDTAGGFVLDEHGNVVGGIRTPWVDVPTARLSGLGQTGAVFASLFGITEPFSSEKLAALYPAGSEGYLAQFGQALTSSVTGGFILPADRAEILGLAAAAFVRA